MHQSQVYRTFADIKIEDILSHASGVATSDIRKVTTSYNHHMWILHLWNWRKVRVTGLQAFRAHLMLCKGL